MPRAIRMHRNIEDSEWLDVNAVARSGVRPDYIGDVWIAEWRGRFRNEVALASTGIGASS